MWKPWHRGHCLHRAGYDIRHITLDTSVIICYDDSIKERRFAARGRLDITQSLAVLRQFSFGTMLLRLLLAMLSGGAVGYGRSRKARAAGLRTYMLISIGTAMAVLLTLYQYQMLTGPWAEVVARVGMKFDAARLASQVITGIGFLGAGIIIKIAHQQVKGLTTATGLFATVIMGIAAGAGLYECVIVALVLIVLVLNVMSPLEIAFKRRLRNITLNVEFRSVGVSSSSPGRSRPRRRRCMISKWRTLNPRTTSIPRPYSSSSSAGRTTPIRACSLRWRSWIACTLCRN